MNGSGCDIYYVEPAVERARKRARNVNFEYRGVDPLEKGLIINDFFFLCLIFLSIGRFFYSGPGL